MASLPDAPSSPPPPSSPLPPKSVYSDLHGQLDFPAALGTYEQGWQEHCLLHPRHSAKSWAKKDKSDIVAGLGFGRLS